jgi:hypothetical protein
MKVSTLGTPPPTVPLPEPGLYWMRLARPRFVSGRCDSLGDFSWDNATTTVELVQIATGPYGIFIDTMGSDEGLSFEDDKLRLVEVIAKIDPPS